MSTDVPAGLSGNVPGRPELRSLPAVVRVSAANFFFFLPRWAGDDPLPVDGLPIFAFKHILQDLDSRRCEKKRPAARGFPFKG